MNDMPRWDENAEQAVLGAMLLSPLAATEAAEALAPEDFYRPSHATVFKAILACQEGGMPVDQVTILNYLQKHGQLGKIGGGPYLHTLIERVPVAANVGYYAETVAECATLRRLVEAGTRIVQLGYAADGQDADEMVERARAELDKLVTTRNSSDTFELEDLIPAALEELSKPIQPGRPTGFTDLDKVLGGGLHPGTVTIIGARPGVGKSILVLQIAAAIASMGHGALMHSLEMSRSELMNRFFAAEAGVELTALHEHRLSEDDWRRVLEVQERAKSWPLAVSDAPRIGITGISSRARDRSRTARGLAMLAVDYLQLVTPSDPRAPREQQVASISRGLKLLSRELNIPVLAAAQVNRGSEARSDKRPTLVDLRESGAIEADADTVILLYENPEHVGELELIVAKNRHGPKTTVTVAWAPHYARARSLARFDH